MSFPLLKLPLIVQKDVIQQMKLIDIIELSMFSYKFRKILYFLRIKATEISFELNKTEFRVIASFPQIEGNGVIFAVVNFRQFHDLCENFKIRKIDGRYFPISRSPERDQGPYNYEKWLINPILDDFKSKSRLLEYALRHILSFGEPKRYSELSFSLKTIPIHLTYLFIWGYITSFQQVSINFSPNSAPLRLQEDELKFLLEEVPASAKKLNVYVKDPKYEYSETLKGSILDILTPNWLDVREICSAQVESLTLNIEKCQWTIDINIFLQQWCMGNNQVMRKFCVHFRPGTEWKEAEIFNGIIVIEIESEAIPEEKDSETIMRIIRRNWDGQLATVSVRKNIFELLVL